MKGSPSQWSFQAGDFALHSASPVVPDAKSFTPGMIGDAVQRTTAKVPDGAGTVEHAGHSVAPALQFDGPGTIIFQLYLPPRQYLYARHHSSGRFVLSRALQVLARKTCHSRGDRSRHPTCRKAGAATGPRNGTGREVSLSPGPVPQSIISPRRLAAGIAPRNCPIGVAMAAP